MGVSRVSLSLEEDVLAEARSRAGRGKLSAYVDEALVRHLQQHRLGELLADMDTESGSLPPELVEEARDLWRAPAPLRVDAQPKTR